MNPALTIYLLGLVLIPIIFGLLNRQFKWLTREQFDNDREDRMMEGIVILTVWPLVAVAVILVVLVNALAMLFRMLFIPK